MRKLLGFLLLAILIFPMSVQAQGTVRFDAVSVEIWPEYDRPDVLVIYRLSLAPDVELPTTLSIRVPAQAEINAVATGVAGGSLFTTQYTPQIEGEWKKITLTTSDSQVQIEFYDPLPKQESDRQFSFQWAGDYAAETFEVYFKLPIDATNFQSEPALTPLGTGTDNLAYYGLTVGGLDAGEIFSLSLDYQKSTARLSTSAQTVEPVEDLGSGMSGFQISEYLPWILGGLGVILIVAGIVYFVLSRKGNKPGSTGRKRHAPTRSEEAVSGATYCHQCGRRAQPGDQFCRACGTRLRREG